MKSIFPVKSEQTLVTTLYTLRSEILNVIIVVLSLFAFRKHTYAKALSNLSQSTWYKLKTPCPPFLTQKKNTNTREPWNGTFQAVACSMDCFSFISSFSCLQASKISSSRSKCKLWEDWGDHQHDQSFTSPNNDIHLIMELRAQMFNMLENLRRGLP